MRTAKNNFDALRLTGALLVAVSHSQYLLTGSEWLGKVTNVQSLGAVGLNLFCVISGYLITQSRMRNPLRTFLASRALRIFPALLVAIPLLAFVAGPLLTTLSLRDYFSSAGTWCFLASVLAIPLNPSLPGVFNAGAIVGQLYSLTPELLFYFFAGVFGNWKRFPALVGILLLAVWSLFIVRDYSTLPFGMLWHPHIKSLVLVVFPVRLSSLCLFYLLMGSALSLLSINRQLISRVLPVLLIVWIVAFKSDRHSYDMIEMMVLPLIIIGIGNASSFTLRIPKFIGDISYGVYIYHFVIAKVLARSQSHIWHTAWGVVLCVIVSCFMGWLSFHLVEKRALARKSSRTLEAVAEVSVAACIAEEAATS